MAGCVVTVWGAGGYLGRNVTDALLSQKMSVRGLGRGEPRMSEHLRTGVDWRKSDFTVSIDELIPLIDGAVSAVHCAGHYEADAAGLALYVDSVRKLAIAGRSSGLRRLVLISSIAVYGRAEGNLLESVLRPETPYARSRLAAEQLAGDILAGSGVDLVIVRVPAVVGADMRANVLRRFFHSLRFGIFVHPGRRDAVFACVGIHRLASLLAFAADPHRPVPSLLQPVDCIPWTVLAERFGKFTGRNPIRIGIPASIAMAAGRIVGDGAVRALQALDNPQCYDDNSASLVASGLVDTMADIDALIATLSK